MAARQQRVDRRAAGQRHHRRRCEEHEHDGRDDRDGQQVLAASQRSGAAPSPAASASRRGQRRRRGSSPASGRRRGRRPPACRPSRGPRRVVPDATIRPSTRMSDAVRQPLHVDEVVAGEQHGDSGCAQAARSGSRVTARASGSIPAVGSSSSATSGRPTRATARPSRCRSPPDSRRYGVRRHGPQPDQVEQLVGVARVGVEGGVLAERLARPCPDVEAAVLEHQADPRAERAAAACRVRAEDPHQPRVGRPVALDRPRRSSSCPRRSARAGRRSRRLATVQVDAVDDRARRRSA